MVTKVQVTHYKCDICGDVWDTEELARECEGEGVPEQKFKLGQRVKLASYYSFVLGISLPPEVDEGTILGTSVKRSLRHIRMYKAKFDGDKEIRGLCESYFEEIKGEK